MQEKRKRLLISKLNQSFEDKVAHFICIRCIIIGRYYRKVYSDGPPVHNFWPPIPPRILLWYR